MKLDKPRTQTPLKPQLEPTAPTTIELSMSNVQLQDVHPTKTLRNAHCLGNRS